MKYIVMDLESTCWEKRTDYKNQEIIEFGALKLNESLELIEEFNKFVRPIVNPQLSQFCKGLTHISQNAVDAAESFEIVFPTFLEWIEAGSYRIATWGEYDIKQIQIDCKRHSIKFPRRFTKKHINVKAKFSEKKRIKPCGMKQALQMMNISLKGIHHRGIDDARNITTIFRKLYI